MSLYDGIAYDAKHLRVVACLRLPRGGDPSLCTMEDGVVTVSCDDGRMP